MACDSDKDFLESLDRLFHFFIFPYCIIFLKEDRIINVNITTVIIRGKEAKAGSLKIKGIYESIIFFSV